MVSVAVGQFGANTDKSGNLKSVLNLIDQAADAGAELVVIPENAMFTADNPTDDITEFLEGLDGPFVTAIQAKAKERKLWVVAGMSETLADNPRASNTVVVVNASGELVDQYRKVHLYDAFGYKESDRVQAAQFVPVTFELGGVTFGVMTCYDLRFPEMARLLIDAGAQAILLPAAWVVGPAKELHWEIMARSRAIENVAYVVACGQTGPRCTGQSMIIDPMGAVVASAGEDPGVAVGPVTAERVAAVRDKNPSLSNRVFTITP